MSRNPISPERMAAVRLHGLACRAGGKNPQGDERARVVTELQNIAADFPHLLAEEAGILIGAHRFEALGRESYLPGAHLLIEAGADLAAVERWAAIGEERVRRAQPKPGGVGT